MSLVVRKPRSKKDWRRVVLAAAGASLGIVFLAAVGVTAAWHDRSTILIESWESKTARGGPVFNRIAFFPGPQKDTWMMQQSHTGLAAQDDAWERIAIVVSRAGPSSLPLGSAPTATYYQLAAGPLDAATLDEVPVPEVGNRAQCYLCHANGPRAIRPAPNGGEVRVSLWDQWRLMIWNMRIKTYGRFAETAQDQDSDYRIQGGLANMVLASPSCETCHPANTPASHGLLPRRGSLRRQHFMAIDFMLRQGLMPPKGFSLPADERDRILAFIGSKKTGKSVFKRPAGR